MKGKKSLFKGVSARQVSNLISIKADKERVWNEITNVKINEDKFPFILACLGIPKPLKAKVMKEGIGGFRIADFSNNAQFHQEILAWDLYQSYTFSFNASNNFRVAYFMNLAGGPFVIVTGRYNLIEKNDELDLELISNYKLKGILGFLFHHPFRFVVYKFQQHLLKGIKANCVANN